jgi:hypothetical protein
LIPLAELRNIGFRRRTKHIPTTALPGHRRYRLSRLELKLVAPEFELPAARACAGCWERAGAEQEAAQGVAGPQHRGCRRREGGGGAEAGGQRPAGRRALVAVQ